MVKEFKYSGLTKNSSYASTKDNGTQIENMARVLAFIQMVLYISELCNGIKGKDMESILGLMEEHMKGSEKTGEWREVAFLEGKA
mmetsp:Transcript_23566/g.3891  ORF Transcript_23566/g.3891 Transcript_23566/m.3891 type:complete len:85 (+) Transcript_23566:125-379(+)|eukprot:CAMPEP_0168315962 /NCGR_PEP_ID=MMETSP0210-20121227/13555_1 /TAXON_ID=40633 /ORGANISM="Condylostoma magnum, Strain COL2" /LENGTH=84 /DNA_ID=CAMNT_0008293223 /DNA_START=125 /DNA_END=379 /DNA_ORIENTATION=+